MMMAGLFFGGCGKRDSTAQSTNSNPVTAPVDYLGAAGQAKRSADKTLGTVGINQAVQSFQAQEGRLPTTLNELVSKNYLPSLPAPPAGTKFDYNPQTGQVRVVPAQ